MSGEGLDLNELEKAANTVLKRHAILRSTFEEHGESAVQVVHEEFIVPVERIQVDEGEMLHRAEVEARKPFNISAQPAFRLVYLSSTDESPALLMLLAHDILFDKWSLGLFWRELVASYRSNSEDRSKLLPELPIEYADFAHWQRNELRAGLADRQLKYWQDRLQSLPGPLDLSGDKKRPVKVSDAGALERRVLAPSIVSKLRKFAAAEDASLFMLVLLGFQIFLNRHTGEEDIVVGTPVANRRHSDLARLIGFFLSTVPIRTDLSGNPSTKEALHRVRAAVLGAIENQDIPFDQIVDAVQPSRSAGQHPIFSVMLVFQREEEAIPPIDIPNTSFEMCYVETKTSKFDLTLFVGERDGGLETLFEYRTDLFSAETIQRMLSRFETLLVSLTQASDASIAKLEILPSRERDAIMRGSEGLPFASEKELFPVTQTIAAFAEKSPDAIAVKSDGLAVSYASLQSRADTLASELQRGGIQPGDMACLFIERSLDAIVALLGIMRAGCAYVPVDPAYPAERIAQILETSACDAVVTIERLRKALPSTEAPVFELDRIEPLQKKFDDGIEGTRPAYVIFTSGSTGSPKGVAVTHKNLSWSTAARSSFYADPPGRFLLVPSLSFDSSVAGIFWTLCSGGTLVPMPPGLEQDINGFADLIDREQITHILCLPSLYGLLLSYTDPARLKSLTTVIVAGEVCPSSLAKQHLRLMPATSLVNEYGPTEGTVWCTAHQVTEEINPVPLGEAVPGANVYVLDTNLNLVPTGTTGEIYIGGSGVAQGYLRNPELTLERFIPDPFDDAPGARLYKTGDMARRHGNGALEFLGRSDDQIKIRGFRVELKEIEETIQSHSAVKEVAVVTQTFDSSRLLHDQLVKLGDERALEMLQDIESNFPS